MIDIDDTPVTHAELAKIFNALAVRINAIDFNEDEKLPSTELLANLITVDPTEENS